MLLEAGLPIKVALLLPTVRARQALNIMKMNIIEKCCINKASLKQRMNMHSTDPHDVTQTTELDAIC